jgi:hypothetical protein
LACRESIFILREGFFTGKLPPCATQRYHRGGVCGKELEVDAADVRRVLLMKLGLRIELEMSRYLAGRFEHSSEAVAVMGGDARTGTAVRRLITPDELSQAALQGASL